VARRDLIRPLRLQPPGIMTGKDEFAQALGGDQGQQND
jgi:hypothetical protein